MSIDGNTWGLIFIGLMQLVTAIVALLARKDTQEAKSAIVETKAIAVETKAIALQTEVNTNSMKDALVASTKDAAHSAGRTEGIAEAKAEAATKAEGRAEEQAKPK